MPNRKDTGAKSDSLGDCQTAKVKEELYLYLLQGRKCISLSVTESNARVVDVAKAS
jgi:hypothetical protein